MKLLLDTNILIDFYAHREPFFNEAEKLFFLGYANEVELWASVLSFADTEYILSGRIPKDQLRSMMKDSLEILKPCAPSATALIDGLESDWSDLEDFLIANCAERVDADLIITRDRRGFVHSRLPTCTPAGFFEWIEENHNIIYEIVDL